MPFRYYITVEETAATHWIHSGKVEILHWSDVMEDFGRGYLSEQKGGGYQDCQTQLNGSCMLLVCCVSGIDVFLCCSIFQGDFVEIKWVEQSNKGNLWSLN